MPSSGDLDTDQGIESERLGSENKVVQSILVIIKTRHGIRARQNFPYILFEILVVNWFLGTFYFELIFKYTTGLV